MSAENIYRMIHSLKWPQINRLVKWNVDGKLREVRHQDSILLSEKLETEKNYINSILFLIQTSYNSFYRYLMKNLHTKYWIINQYML